MREVNGTDAWLSGSISLLLWLVGCSSPERDFISEDAGSSVGGKTTVADGGGGTHSRVDAEHGDAGSGRGGAEPSVTDAPPEPGNRGVLEASEQTFTAAVVSWSDASDDITPKDRLEYRVYQSAEDNIQSLDDVVSNGTPSTEFEAAMTRATVTLDGGKDNFFNVVVRDETGNKNAYQMVIVSFSEAESCSQNNECFSGTCQISYRDRDGDKWGDDSTTVGRCDGSVPAGYVKQNGDCCDRGGDDAAVAKKINPGQMKYQDEAANLCGITWDYNCDSEGEIETYPYGCRRGASPPDCPAQTLQVVPESPCGGWESALGCFETGGSCESLGQNSVIVGCR